jgi:DNA-binding CsgD family transcriptional regulator
VTHDGGWDGFVGRTGELAALRVAWQAARSGSARIVGITGDQGIGKATLVSRFLTGVDVPVIRMTAEDIDASTPWAAFREVVAQTPGRRLAQRAATLGPDAEPGLIGIDLLCDLRSAKGMLLVVEEAQWVDRQSMMALHYASRRLRYDPVMVILSYSPQDPRSKAPYFGRSWPLLEAWQHLFAGDHGLLLTLDGLPAADLVRLAAHTGHAALSPERAARLHDATGGNPSYVKEVLRTSMKSVMSGQGPLEIPKEIAPAIAAGLASCERETRELVIAGAVLGRRFSVAQVRFVSGLASVAEPIEQAIAAGLLVEVPGTDGRELAFAKKLTRDVVYHDLGRRMRAELHRRCAVTTSGGTSLAHRVASVEGGVDEILADELASAAAERLAVSDVAGAAWYLRSALDCTPPGPERLRLVLTAVETLLVAGELAAVQEYEGELERAQAGPWRDYVLAYLKLLSGRVAAAKELLHGALATLASDGAEHAEAPVDLHARIAAQLAIIGVVFLSYPDMIEYGTVAVEAESPDPSVDGFAWFARTVGMALNGESTEALTLLARAGEPGDRAGMERLVARGMIRLWTDDLDGAAADLHEVVRRATEGHALRVSQGLGFLGEVEYRRGRLGEAGVFTSLAVGNAEFHGRVWDFPILHALACYPCAATGDWQAAEHHAASSAQLAALIDTNTAYAYAAGARAAIAQARGDGERLLAAADELEAHYDSAEPGTHLFGPVRADALAQLGRLDEAETALAAFMAGPASRGRRSARMTVARVTAQIALGHKRYDRAREQCAVAAELAAGVGLPLEEARVGMVLAQCHHGLGQRAAAERALRTARTQFIRLGAEAYRQLVEGLAERLGLVIATTTPLEALTAKEREVARLAAEGKTNQQIIESLHRSPKTIETHMSNIRRKLNIADRNELKKLFEEEN